MESEVTIFVEEGHNIWAFDEKSTNRYIKGKVYRVNRLDQTVMVDLDENERRGEYRVSKLFKYKPIKSKIY